MKMLRYLSCQIANNKSVTNCVQVCKQSIHKYACSMNCRFIVNFFSSNGLEEVCTANFNVSDDIVNMISKFIV